MKKLALLLSFALVVLSLTACFPFTDREEASKGPSVNISDSVSETVSESVSEIVSDEVSENPLAEMTASELYDYALEKMDELHSYIADADMDMVVKTDGKQASVNMNLRQKTSGYGTEDEVTGLTYSNPAMGINASFYYKDGVGYYSTLNERYSFDCTFDELEDLANLIAFSDYADDDEDDSAVDYVLERAEVSADEQGNIIISYNGTVTDKESIEVIFGVAPQEQSDEHDYCIDFKVTVSAEGYILNEVLKMESAANVSGTVVENIAILTTTTSHLNEKVDVIILDTGYTHVGSIDVVYASKCYDYLKVQQDYKTTTSQKYVFNGLGTSDSYTLDRTFNLIRSESPRFSFNNVITINGTKNQGYRYLGEGNTMYVHDGQKLQESEMGALDDDTMLSFWLLLDASLAYGKDFSYTDNGNGSAVLTFKYTDETVLMFANYYAYITYGEDYYGMFDEADNVTVNFADVIITIDTETGALLSHQYHIDARFIFDGEGAVFVEKTTITASVDNVTVPEKNVFFGTSGL